VIIMNRPLAILFTSVLLLVGSLGLADGVAAATIGPTTRCSNGVDNAGGLGLICEVTVINTITSLGGTASVTVRECHGAAGDPEASCTTRTRIVPQPVTLVNQCNDSINGGGGTLRCSVRVRNRFIGVSPGATAATVNQCVGSGDGDTTGCDPFPATTSGATITQCNGSANGGTLVELTCIAAGTTASALNVRINQCNGSGNGGGGLVICSSDIRNNVVAGGTPTPAPTATGTPGPTATGTPGGTATSTLPPTAKAATTGLPGSVAAPLVFVGLFLLTFALVATGRRLRATRTG
jgi:hypothetical protein